ncbi:MAG: RsmE family RNA methyltransferase [Polyangiaceae bacterium]
MNLLLFSPDEVASSGRVTVTDRRLAHLKKVLDVELGQRLRAGIERTSTGFAEVRSIAADHIELRYEASAPVATPMLDLVLALPRPKALSRMVQAAASFGVRRIDVINAWRVDAAYFQSHKVTDEALRTEVLLGCEQGLQAYVPHVAVHRYFSAFIEELERAGHAPGAARQLLVGHPNEPDWPSQGIETAFESDAMEPLTLVIGPDGGFIDRELRSLQGLGGELVHFGDAVLRSEIALISGLSQLSLLRRLRGTTGSPRA